MCCDDPRLDPAPREAEGRGRLTSVVTESVGTPVEASYLPWLKLSSNSGDIFFAAKMSSQRDIFDHRRYLCPGNLSLTIEDIFSRRYLLPQAKISPAGQDISRCVRYLADSQHSSLVFCSEIVSQTAQDHTSTQDPLGSSDRDEMVSSVAWRVEPTEIKEE